MVQHVLQLLRSQSARFVFRGAKQPISVKKKGVAWFKVERGFRKFGPLDQAQRRCDRWDRFCRAVTAEDEKRWMTRSYDVRAPGCVIKRHTHRSHERASAKNAAKVIVHCFQHARWPVVFHAAMVKEKLCQR